MLETSINQNFLSLTENIDEDIGECNYSEKKEFGDCNRKSTMATSNDESFTSIALDIFISPFPFYLF